MASIELLSSEPDLLVQIFLYLDLADLTSIEDVCTEWRDLGNLSNVYCSIFLKKKIQLCTRIYGGKN